VTPTPELALLALAVTVGYVLLCAVWPFRPCSRCAGTGKRRGPVGGIRRCPTCRATGLRIRAGRHLWNYLRRTRDEGMR